MLLLYNAYTAARDAYRRALDVGADDETAMSVALARLRAYVPAADEWELRAAFGKRLAADRLAEAAGLDINKPSPHGP